MKTTSSPIRQCAIFLGVFALVLIFVIRPASGQEAGKKDGKSTIKLKIIREADGKTTVIDTTITGDAALNKEQVESIVADLRSDMKEMEGDMKEMQMDLEMEWADSGMQDSLHRMQQKIMIMGEGCGKHGMKIRCCPKGFNYNFDMPCVPDFEMPEVEGFEWYGMDGGCDPRVFRFNHQGGGQTLSDIIGDIPMDRVKSYSIKDKKNGKRIVIDIEDAPLMERDNRVIILRNAPAVAPRGDRQDRDVKVIIKTDDDGKSKL